MKLSQKEIFILELERAEWEFLLQVIDQMSLSQGSSPLAAEVCNKFKKLKSDYLGVDLDPPPTTLTCDGCSITEQVIMQKCPISSNDTPLCVKCYQFRQSYSEQPDA